MKIFDEKNIFTHETVSANNLDVNEPEIICFSIQTTGLNPSKDEILQISVIDGNGSVFFDSFIRPIMKSTWHETECIHKIAPANVSHSPLLQDVSSVLQRMFYSTKLIVSYNIKFSMKFLEQAGIYLPSKNYYDVMTEFASIYGEWNDYHGNYKFQSLATCAKYYDYNLPIQNNLEKARAILHCYKKIIENSDMQL